MYYTGLPRTSNATASKQHSFDQDGTAACADSKPLSAVWTPAEAHTDSFGRPLALWCTRWLRQQQASWAKAIPIFLLKSWPSDISFALAICALASTLVWKACEIACAIAVAAEFCLAQECKLV